MIQFEDYRQSIFRFALNLTNDWDLAEDLTQDCLLQAIRSQHQLADSQRVLGWLARIARNLWFDLKRKKKIETESLDSDYLQDKSVQSSFDRLSMDESAQACLNQMQQLPERQREVLYLFAVEDFTVAEIAEALETSKNAVKVNLSHARKAMRRWTTEIG